MSVACSISNNPMARGANIAQALASFEIRNHHRLSTTTESTTLLVRPD